MSKENEGSPGAADLFYCRSMWSIAKNNGENEVYNNKNIGIT